MINWIRVEDGLPEETDEYIVYAKESEHLAISQFEVDDGNWYDSTACIDGDGIDVSFLKITHWAHVELPS